MGVPDPEPRVPLTTLLRETIGDQLEVTLSRDDASPAVWVTVKSGQEAPRRYRVTGAMKTFQIGERFLAAGVIDPPGSVRAVELQLLGSDRLEATVCPEGWLLVLPPSAGDHHQRVTVTYRTGETVESETLPPAAASIDSGGTSYASI